MRFHIDFGYFCWQVVSVIQPSAGHDIDDDDEVIELESTTSIGFKPNAQRDEDEE